MTIETITKYLTPGLWIAIDRRQMEEGIQIQSTANAYGTDKPAIICSLAEYNWQANGQLIATAPMLLTTLYLTLQALDQPQLQRIARKRGHDALEQATGYAQIKPDPCIQQLLSEAGIAEPTLTELALTTTPDLVQAWLYYARQNNLGNGFVVTQLRAGTHPHHAQPKRWFTEAERQQFFAT
ncbi:MAG: hypothetical protein AAF629_31315 [Chloroflexota bacterium]